MFMPALLSLNVMMPLSSSADEINLGTELDFSLSSSKTTNAGTGDVTKNRSSGFGQHYKINLMKEIYPYLSLRTGGSFTSDSITTTSDEIETERTTQTIRPYLELNLKSPLVGVNVGFRRVQIKEEATSLPLTKNFKDDWNVNLKWSPSGLPRFRIFHTQTHTYDDADTLDSYDTLTTLKAGYTAFKKIPLNYAYGRNSIENEITNYELLRQTHDANVNYSDNFFSKRLFMDTNYKIRHKTTSFPGSSQSTVSSLSPSQGIFSLDDTPQDGPALAALTALIDGDINTSSGMNIGWSQASGNKRNIGLDFGVPTSIDKIYISVDRNIPSSASSTFSWAVYTSPDNTNISTWTLHTTVIPADFGVFQNRFTISFPEVTARYIKVVASPLSSAFVVNPELENIFVTEMQSFVITTSNTETKLVSVEHSYGLNLLGKVSEYTSVGYSFFFTLKDIDPATEKTTFSNNVYTNHAFNKIFSTSIRVGMDNGETTIGSSTSESTSNTYTAMVKAAYLETFQQTLTYSKNILTEDEAKSSSYTVFLRNNAKLYSGWDAVFDAGYNQSTSQDNTKTSSTIIRAGSSIIPNERLSVDLHYTGTKQSGETPGNASSFRQTYNVQALYYPFRTLTLFARINVKDDDKQDDLRVLQNYSANWSPFRDGALQLFLTYNEMLRSADEQKERIIGPGLKWNISRYAVLDMSYYYTSVESALITTDTSNFRISLKMTF